MLTEPKRPSSNQRDGFDLAPPQAASLVESLRAFSYELPSAIADLVDNSITAHARNVWVDFHWDGANSVISLTDDGDGMTEKMLIAAMRPGSQSPLALRTPHDLGRFGLGLKTASFSQGRRLTVRSSTRSSSAATRCWDLDHVTKVNDWQLLRYADTNSELHFQRLAKIPHGTAVVLQKLDRLVAGNSIDNAKQQDLFLQRATAVRDHLAMVFHLLMAGRNGVKLWMNQRLIEPWDPFLPNEKATQQLGITSLKLNGSVIQIEPFVLPHHSRISKRMHEKTGGLYGWNAHQGFYVYRNRRLLMAGDWLGLGWRKEEHYKLARIRVEIPNALDHDWCIDVTKSRAVPPPGLREDLRRIGEATRMLAKRVYSHRGAKISPTNDTERIFLWEPLAKHNKTFYKINRTHPLVKLALTSSSDTAALNALLRLVEETVPIPHITIENSEKPNSLAAPFEQVPEQQIQEVMSQAFRSLVATGYGSKEAVDRLSTIWPFHLFPALLQTLKESHNNA